MSRYIGIPIASDKKFELKVAQEYATAQVVVDHRQLLAQVNCSPGCEPDLALCLASLVRVGMLDVEKLRAALVLAEPVALEIEEIRTALEKEKNTP